MLDTPHLPGLAGARPPAERSLASGRLAQGKGTNFLGLLATVERRFGVSARAKVLAACRGELKDALTHQRVLSSGWYPVAWYVGLHRAVQQALGQSPSIAHDLSRESTKHDLGGIYRLLMFLLTPESIIKRAPRIMSQYWTGGTLSVQDAALGTIVIQWRDWYGFDGNIWLDMVGGAVGALEAAGARDVKTRCLEGGGEGDSALVLHLTWT